MLLATVLPWVLTRRGSWRTRRPGAQAVRATAMVISSVVWLYGLRALPLAECTAMVFSSPLLVTALALVVLGERVRPRQWLQVGAGFIGVLIVVRPTSLSYGGAEIFPLLSSAAWAVAVIATRKTSEDSLVTSLLYAAVLGTVVLGATLPAIDARAVAQAGWPLLAMAIVWASAHWLVALAYRLAAPARVAPFSYSQLVWAGLFGFAVFGHVPDGISLAGMALIMASGISALAFRSEKADSAHQ
jgi:drug/metabolite transporter (DMT)-like permease